MRACVDMGRAAVVTGDRDEFGDEYQTIRVMTVADAIKLRDELTDVIEQVSRLPCIGGCKCDAAAAKDALSHDDYLVQLAKLQRQCKRSGDAG